MTNYREILRLHSLGYSQRRIESSVRCSHHTVKQVMEKAREHKITWPLEENVTNEALEALFTGRASSSNEKYAEPEYSYIHKELAKSGVTMTLLWNEYCEKSRSEGKTQWKSSLEEVGQHHTKGLKSHRISRLSEKSICLRSTGSI